MPGTVHGNYVIYTEREIVLYHGIKTPRSVLKNEAVKRKLK